MFLRKGEQKSFFVDNLFVKNFSMRLYNVEVVRKHGKVNPRQVKFHEIYFRPTFRKQSAYTEKWKEKVAENEKKSKADRNVRRRKSELNTKIREIKIKSVVFSLRQQRHFRFQREKSFNAFFSCTTCSCLRFPCIVKWCRLFKFGLEKEVLKMEILQEKGRFFKDWKFAGRLKFPCRLLRCFGHQRSSQWIYQDWFKSWGVGYTFFFILLMSVTRRNELIISYVSFLFHRIIKI